MKLNTSRTCRGIPYHLLVYFFVAREPLDLSLGFKGYPSHCPPWLQLLCTTLYATTNQEHRITQLADSTTIIVRIKLILLTAALEVPVTFAAEGAVLVELLEPSVGAVAPPRGIVLVAAEGFVWLWGFEPTVARVVGIGIVELLLTTIPVAPAARLRTSTCVMVMAGPPGRSV